MEISTVIEVESYGDYDVRYTKCIMVSPVFRHASSLMKNFCEKNGLPLNGEGLPDNMLEDTTNEYIKYLKKEGFKELKTNKACFTD